MPRTNIFDFIPRFCLTSVFFLSLYAQGEELDRLQEAISTQRQKVEQTDHQRDQLSQEIDHLKQQLSQLIEKENNLKQRLITTKKEQKKIDSEYKGLQNQMAKQKKQLANIATTIYQARLNPSLLEQLFSNEAKKTQIAQHYWRYFSYQKQKALQDLANSEASLIEKETHIKKQQQLLNEQQQQLEEIKTEHQKTAVLHQQALDKLNVQLQAEKTKLATLITNEKKLREKIEKTKREAAKLAFKHRQNALLSKANQGLGNGKKQFSFPVKGSVLHHFNTPQLGELRWRGVVIKAPQGQKVQAIFAGQVIFAGSLAGYGEMVILKHGKNDLSLYGYNQSLLVNTGDVVDTGQEIAHVGQINGENQSGLYFEISRKGEGVNPLLWLN